MPRSRAGRFVDVELRRIQLTRAGRGVLHDVDWRIRPGERWILAGANGAGKTQLLKLVAGAVWPAPGAGASRRYLWRGEHWTTPREVQEQIAYIGAERQDKYERYAWDFTAWQVIGTGLHRTDIPLQQVTRADGQRIERALAALAIEHLADRRFLSLSYGERRLTLIARALAPRPGLVLFDEVLNGLDATHRQRVLAWLVRSRRARLPWVLATHRIEDVPPSATHALILERGRVVYRGALARAPLAHWLDAKSRGAVRQVRSPSAVSPQSIVRLTNACVYLDERVVLRDVSLDVRTGQSWVVHGPNGSGKTTLLRTLYGDHGVAVGGRVVRAGIKRGVPLEFFRRQVGLVAPHLQADHPQDLIVEAVVQSGCHAAIGLDEPASALERAAARRALLRFGIARLGARRLRELSYGQLRRVLFARACVNEPRLLLLDEPFAGVDVPTRRALQHYIQDLAARGTTIVMATHHRTEWPASTTHELELADGRMRYGGRVRVT
ncbi:MAG TPA: ATP-binding cassette domain-containing protein [Steroidobacteraceae bacterium]|nr:ATP-binding cassette domain-containing protein [Steroidobacteraceae bacterium]